jgi:proteasome assembly chaperone (PAC2) family protein
MAEARVRVMGVSSASEIVDQLLEHFARTAAAAAQGVGEGEGVACAAEGEGGGAAVQAGELSKLGKLQALRAVACMVVQ